MAGDLTEMQRNFVFHYVRNKGNATQAAELAKYGTPAARGCELLKNPAILTALKAERDRYIQADLASLAFDTIRGILTDTSIAAGVRLDAAKFTAGLAGHVAPKGDAVADKARALRELGADELATLLKLARAPEIEQSATDHRATDADFVEILPAS
jgi:hypothetical protein